MQLNQNKLFNGTQFTNIFLSELNLNYSTYREGRTIYREGDATKNLFLILEGEVNLISSATLKDDQLNSLILSDGDFFGYDEHYYSITRNSKAIALKDTEIIMVSMEELNNLIVKDWIIIDNLKNNIHFPLPAKKSQKPRKNIDAKNSLPIFTLNEPTLFNASESTIALTDHKIAAKSAAISPKKII